ncbi:MAG: dual specificity protein phosphatase family protein [Parachlamydiaceae bacterium]|nr:dual specificity protein phosphatase family protein [Parachlamydiaceae bacterium]
MSVQSVSGIVSIPKVTVSKKVTENNRSIGHLIGRVLHTLLPRGWFCWISRGIIQIQAIIKPHKWSYWTKLSDEIYLGAMPLKNWKHIEKITNLGIKAILSINEDYEFKKQLFADPVKPEDWKKRNINFLTIASPDLEPIELSKIAIAVNYVVEQVKLGNKIYVHCTGGRARSVSIAICSLVMLKRYTLEESINFVKQCRPQVMLSQNQLESMLSWYNKNQSISNSTRFE